MNILDNLECTKLETHDFKSKGYFSSLGTASFSNLSSSVSHFHDTIFIQKDTKIILDGKTITGSDLFKMLGKLEELMKLHYPEVLL